MKDLVIKDSLNFEDMIARASRTAVPGNQNKGWRSAIVGKNKLGEVLFEAENRLSIGGAFYTLGALFGVMPPFKVDYVNDIMGIATGGDPIDEAHPVGMRVQLFGVGTGGADESISNVYPVYTKERTLDEMVPFRYTDALTAEEETKYFFKKPDPATGKNMYYLKRFAAEPDMRALWVDASKEGEDGTPVQVGVHNSPRQEAIDVFVEMPLDIDALDLREYFQAHGDIEKTRFNTVGIFSGILADCGGYLDYKNVTMIAKYNIPNEMLVLNKDLTMFYRVYAV